MISGRNRSEQSIRSSAKGVSFYSIRKVAHISIFSVTRSADSSVKITELFDSPISHASRNFRVCFPFRSSRRNHRSHFFFTPSEFEDECPAISSAGKITETTLRLIIVTFYRDTYRRFIAKCKWSPDAGWRTFLSSSAPSSLIPEMVCAGCLASPKRTLRLDQRSVRLAYKARRQSAT